MGSKTATYEVTKTDKGLIKAWTKGVPVEDSARLQLSRIADMPFIFKHVAVMAAQADLVEPVYELRQVVCVKG